MLIDIPDKGFLFSDQITNIERKRFDKKEGAVYAHMTNGKCITIYSGSLEGCSDRIMKIHDAYLNGDSHVIISKEG